MDEIINLSPYSVYGEIKHSDKSVSDLWDELCNDLTSTNCDSSYLNKFKNDVSTNTVREDKNNLGSIWIARDKSGALHLFTINEPYREGDMWINFKDGEENYTKLPKSLYSEVTWESGIHKFELKKPSSYYGRYTDYERLINHSFSLKNTDYLSIDNIDNIDFVNNL